MSDLLSRLVGEARAEYTERREHLDPRELERQALAAPKPRPFAPALKGERLRVIAETKAATPIAGRLAGAGYSPAQLARAYTAGGAAAISVLCQQTSFGGDPQHLREARGATELPLLQKDFVVDEYQLLESRAWGADGVLLIVAALPGPRLRQLVACARDLGLEPLVEVHTASEVEAALEAEASVIGVNHRDLTTFAVDLSLTERLRPKIPSAAVLVAESGIRTAADAGCLRGAGADAVLVGEALMRSADPAAMLKELAAL